MPADKIASICVIHLMQSLFKNISKFEMDDDLLVGKFNPGQADMKF